MNKKNSQKQLCKNGCSKRCIALNLCLACYKKQYRLKNLGKIRKEQLDKYHMNRESKLASMRKFKYSLKGRFSCMKSEAKRRGLACTITKEQHFELLKNPCYYCEKPMPTSVGAGLDRINNNRGYEIDNVLTACGPCNVLRMNNLTVEETKLLSMTLRKFREGRDEESE